MLQRIIDLSMPIENGEHSDPPGWGPKIQYLGHHDTTGDLGRIFPGFMAEQFPDSEGWAGEIVTLSTHNGTHMDAPWHYASRQDVAVIEGGRPAETIDQVPLDWCFRPGVKLDFRQMKDGHVVTAEELDAEFSRIEHVLRPLDIVVINTSAGERYGQANFIDSGCGLGREATLYLIERGVRIVGTDAWSWDAPFSHTAKRWAETNDPSIIWEGHKAGRERGYYQMEKLHNLESLPASGFMLCCFPIKIRAASAGWTRAVAIFDERFHRNGSE